MKAKEPMLQTPIDKFIQELLQPDAQLRYLEELGFIVEEEHKNLGKYLG